MAYDGAIPGDGRIGGRCFGQAVDELVPRGTSMRADVVQVDGVRTPGLDQLAVRGADAAAELGIGLPGQVGALGDTNGVDAVAGDLDRRGILRRRPRTAIVLVVVVDLEHERARLAAHGVLRDDEEA